MGRWTEREGAGGITGLDVLNDTDRYVAAAILPRLLGACGVNRVPREARPPTVGVPLRAPALPAQSPPRGVLRRGAAPLFDLLASLALTDARGGLLQSAFILAHALVSPLAGWVGDRQRRLPLATVGVLVWSAAPAASGLALLVLARAVIGVGEASYAVR